MAREDVISVKATDFTLLDVWAKAAVKIWCTKRVRVYFKGTQFFVNGVYSRIGKSYRSKWSKLYFAGSMNPILRFMYV